MKKYNKLVVGSLLTALILSTPALSFADNNKGENEGNKNGIKTTMPLELKLEKDKENKKENRENKQENRIVTGENKQENKVMREDQKDSGFFSNWFKNHSGKIVAAPAISNLTAVSTKPTKATIKWNTDNRANSYVWYSTTSPVDTSVKPTMKHNNKVLNHKIELKRLLPNTTYYVVVGDSNNKGDIKSSEISFTTVTTLVDTVAPVISKTAITLNADKTVTISWNTNELATSSVYYGTISPLDLSATTTKSVIDTALATKHSLIIPGLTSSTLYHFTLKSADALNNVASSSESTFTTI